MIYSTLLHWIETGGMRIKHIYNMFNTFYLQKMGDDSLQGLMSAASQARSGIASVMANFKPQWVLDLEEKNMAINESYNKLIKHYEGVSSARSKIMEFLDGDAKSEMDFSDMNDDIADYYSDFVGVGMGGIFREIVDLSEDTVLQKDDITFDDMSSKIQELIKERDSLLIHIPNPPYGRSEANTISGKEEVIDVSPHLLTKKTVAVKAEEDLDELVLIMPKPKTVRIERVVTEPVVEDEIFTIDGSEEIDDGFMERNAMINNIEALKANTITEKGEEYVPSLESYISTLPQINNISHSLAEGQIEYYKPDEYRYMSNKDRIIVDLNLMEVASRREKLGLEQLTSKEDELDSPELYEITKTYDAEAQKRIVEGSKLNNTSNNVFCHPVIYRYVSGKLMTTINYVDRYVNVTRLLEYAYRARYITSKRNIGSWFKTRLGRLYMNTGVDRFKRGILHPRMGKIYKKNIRMGYRVVNKLTNFPCVNDILHKGTYVHPRIAHAVARWVGAEFALLFQNEYEEAVEKYVGFKSIDITPEPLYETPMLPSEKQILIYRRIGSKYRPGEVNLSVGDKAYINTLRKKPKIIILYHAISVPMVEQVMSVIGLNVNYNKTYPNKYDFISLENLQRVIEICSDMDTLPGHMSEVWRDDIISPTPLRSITEEKIIFHAGKKEEYLGLEVPKSPARHSAFPDPDGYWKTPVEFSTMIDGVEMIHVFPYSTARTKDWLASKIKYDEYLSNKNGVVM